MEFMNTMKHKKRLILFAICSLLVIKATATELKPGMNLIRNGDFESSLKNWRTKQPVGLEDTVSVDATNALFMNAPFYERKGYINKVSAQQCVVIGDAVLFTVKAMFQYDELPLKSHGHRLSLIWFENDSCSKGGQFGSYLEPDIIPGWQQLSRDSLKPALNARSVQLIITQDQSLSAIELSFLEKTWARLIGFFGYKYEPELAPGYWDNVQLIASKIQAAPEIYLRLPSSHTLAFGKNYLKNGAFNTGEEYWRVSSRGKWVDNEGYIEPGAIRTTVSSQSGSMGVGVFKQCVNFGTQQKFDMSIHFKRDEQSTSTGGGRIRPTWYSLEDCKGQSKISSKHADPEPVSGWQELKVKGLIPPKGSYSVNISIIQSIDGPGYFTGYWDDAYFKASGE